ncbi:unnamed protein product [Rotaria sordida]|uniref:Uncharacterized protein n=2 Tax=Rotaria sordida TaxID=392033 RepID=A0A819JLV2_9BILA|nr:unnamed protein product [Rotaria sordida]
MQHTQKTEKVGMIILPSIFGSKPSSVTEDPQIQRTSKILLIILGIMYIYMGELQLFGTIDLLTVFR